MSAWLGTPSKMPNWGPVSILRLGNMLILEGYDKPGALDGSVDIKPVIIELMHDFDTNRALLIEAGRIGLTPEGVTQWIDITNSILRPYQLQYMRSQLAAFLEDDSRYQHPRSTFPDHYTNEDEEGGPQHQI